MICQSAPVAVRTVSRNVGEGVSPSCLSSPRALTDQALIFAAAVPPPCRRRAGAHPSVHRAYGPLFSNRGTPARYLKPQLVLGNAGRKRRGGRSGNNRSGLLQNSAQRPEQLNRAVSKLGVSVKPSFIACAELAKPCQEMRFLDAVP